MLASVREFCLTGAFSPGTSSEVEGFKIPKAIATKIQTREQPQEYSVTSIIVRGDHEYRDQNIADGNVFDLMLCSSRQKTHSCVSGASQALIANHRRSEQLCGQGKIYDMTNSKAVLISYTESLQRGFAIGSTPEKRPHRPICPRRAAIETETTHCLNVKCFGIMNAQL